MPTCSVEQTDVIRQYYAAFPALDKGRDTPIQYYQPPPQWCRKPAQTMLRTEGFIDDWNSKQKKLTKERRNSYGQRKSRKNLFGKCEGKAEQLPEWMTHEGVWDMESQDPVKEFIRAIAMDEGYVTCENTVVDEIKQMAVGGYRKNVDLVPDLDDSFDFNPGWIVTELAEEIKPRSHTPSEIEMYTQFQAKFNSSIEALWSNDQNTPDDEYQDLPIDFQDLLSSPSDNIVLDQPVNLKQTLKTDTKWPPENAFISKLMPPTIPTKDEYLFSLFRPLTITDILEPEPQQSFLGEMMADGPLSVINHSRDSGFVQVPTRGRARAERMPYTSVIEAKSLTEKLNASLDGEDLLTSTRTHFQPIRHETDADAVRYADGATFDVDSELDAAKYVTTDSGEVFLESSLEQYLEYKTEGSFRLRFPLRQTDAAVQTDERWPPCAGCGRAAKKMRADDGGVCASCTERVKAAEGAKADEPDEGGGEREIEAALSPERKRRHSAAMRCGARSRCTHPHAPFLQCCVLAADRPLTR